MTQRPSRHSTSWTAPSSNAARSASSRWSPRAGDRLLRPVAAAARRALPDLGAGLGGLRRAARLHVHVPGAPRHGLAVRAPGGDRRQRAAAAGRGAAALARLRPAAGARRVRSARDRLGLDHDLRHRQHDRRPASRRRCCWRRSRSWTGVVFWRERAAHLERRRAGPGLGVHPVGPAPSRLSAAARLRRGRALRRVRRRAVPVRHRPRPAVRRARRRARPAGGAHRGTRAADRGCCCARRRTSGGGSRASCTTRPGRC